MNNDELSPEPHPRSLASNQQEAFTLLELLSVMAIVGIIASVAIPEVLSAIGKTRYAVAKQTLRGYASEIIRFKTQKGRLPSGWGELGQSSPPTDPWGNEYVYQNHNDIKPGKRRKDGPTVPINSQFDIFSPGPDGEWKPTIQVKASQDDVIVAGDGEYIGRARDY